MTQQPMGDPLMPVPVPPEPVDTPAPPLPAPVTPTAQVPPPEVAQPAKVPPTTSGLTAYYEKLADAVAQKTYDNIQALQKVAGDRPWGGVKLSATEKLDRFRQVKDIPDFWAQRNQAEAQTLGLQPGLWSKSLVLDAMKLEQQHRSGK